MPNNSLNLMDVFSAADALLQRRKQNKTYEQAMPALNAWVTGGGTGALPNIDLSNPRVQQALSAAMGAYTGQSQVSEAGSRTGLNTANTEAVKQHTTQEGTQFNRNQRVLAEGEQKLGVMPELATFLADLTGKQTANETGRLQNQALQQSVNDVNAFPSSDVAKQYPGVGATILPHLLPSLTQEKAANAEIASREKISTQNVEGQRSMTAMQLLGQMLGFSRDPNEVRQGKDALWKASGLPRPPTATPTGPVYPPAPQQGFVPSWSKLQENWGSKMPKDKQKIAELPTPGVLGTLWSDVLWGSPPQGETGIGHAWRGWGDILSGRGPKNVPPAQAPTPTRPQLPSVPNQKQGNDMLQPGGGTPIQFGAPHGQSGPHAPALGSLSDFINLIMALKQGGLA